MFDLISLVSFFVLGVIGWITYKTYIWPYYISPLRKIPGPPSENPFYGNLKTLLTEESGEPQLRWVKQYGTIVKFHGIFNEPNIFVADPKILQEISVNQVYEYIKPPSVSAIAVFGRGLLFAEGDDHKRQRKMMAPAFTHSNIKEMVPTFTRVAFTLKRLIEDKVNQGESNINLTPYISKATLDIIGSCYEFNSLTSQNELAEAYDSLMNAPVTVSRIAMNLLSDYIPYIRKIPMDVNKTFNHGCTIINRVSKKLVEEKYKEAKNGEMKGKDLLSLLININKTLPYEEKMTDEELKYQDTKLRVFQFVGLYIFLHNIHLLREELVKAFPDKSKFNPTLEEINSLEYLNCVVKETLRLNSPVPSTKRINIKDKVFGDYVIPKGTTIAPAMSVIHRLPSIWGPTADDFDPKRWLDPSLIEKISNLNYLPFLNGPRGCIGGKVALTEFKLLLSMLIRNFVFQPIEGFHIKKKGFPFPKPDPYLGLDVSIIES